MSSQTDDGKPLVSCVMPTADRRSFVPHAIDYFLAQDYPNRELVILDDGRESVSDLIPPDARIRYERLIGSRTLGAKRNACVEAARGDLIMHWDDDDWMASWRIRYQVDELIAADAEVCGLREMLWLELATGKSWIYRYPANAQPWLAGNTLLYTRAFWQRSPFPDIQVASDTSFIFNHSLDRAVELPNHTFYVGMIHPANTSTKSVQPPYWSPWPGDLRAITGNDLEFVGRQEAIGSNSGGTTFLDTNGALPASNSRVHDLRNLQPPVSVCLLSYRRPQHMQRIVDSLHSYPFVDEILIWNNGSRGALALHGEKVRVIDSPENTVCYGRFLCAKQARNDVIYVQDDDAVIRNVQQLYDAFLADGSRIVHGLSDQHYAQRDRTYYPGAHLALLGWGAFFRKEWLGILDTYLATHGKDHLFQREADKFFSLLLGQQHQTFLADLQLLEHHATPGIALYLERDHQLKVALAVRRALASLREAKSIPFPPAWNVVIPCHNYGAYLREAVESVLQNDADAIITIVDDGSSDDTAAIGRELSVAYSEVTYIRHERATGVGHARNVGIAAQESLFVVMLDADDKIGPNYLFEAERLLRSGSDVANPDAILFGQQQSRWPVPETATLQMLLQRNPVHCCSGFRRSYWAQVGGIDEDLKNWEDYDFWIRVAADGARIRRVPGDHFFYRRHGLSKSSSIEPIEEALRATLRRKHRELYESVK